MTLSDLSDLSSIHCPRAWSRITLEITDVRVERLNDISEADARAEGLCYSINGWHASEPQNTTDGVWSDPRRAFRSLWESINGDGSWALNPFVWAISFKRIEAQRREMEGKWESLKLNTEGKP